MEAQRRIEERWCEDRWQEEIKSGIAKHITERMVDNYGADCGAVILRF